MALEVGQPGGDELMAMGVSWPIWTCEVSTFD